MEKKNSMDLTPKKVCTGSSLATEIWICTSKWSYLQGCTVGLLEVSMRKEVTAMTMMKDMYAELCMRYCELLMAKRSAGSTLRNGSGLMVVCLLCPCRGLADIQASKKHSFKTQSEKAATVLLHIAASLSAAEFI